VARRSLKPREVKREEGLKRTGGLESKRPYVSQLPARGEVQTKAGTPSRGEVLTKAGTPRKEIEVRYKDLPAGGVKIVPIAPKKKKKPKEEEEKPIGRWSSASFSWPASFAADLVIPSVPWVRRIAGVCATCTNVQAPGTALVLEILPGADNAVSFRTGTGDGAAATGDLVYVLACWDPTLGSPTVLDADAVVAGLPPDLWITPNDRLRLRWSDDVPLALGTIVGVVIRWELTEDEKPV